MDKNLKMFPLWYRRLVLLGVVLFDLAVVAGLLLILAAVWQKVGARFS